LLGVAQGRKSVVAITAKPGLIFYFSHVNIGRPIGTGAFMGRMQSRLEQLLGVKDVRREEIPYPRLQDVMQSGRKDTIDDVYKRLGGILPNVEVNLRRWDMEFEGIAVELDEFLHFNRYRAMTLESDAYAELVGFPLKAYRDYCREFESRCLSAGGYGGRWTSPSCERQFGSASAPKVLEGHGSPRWKQRAFYDFVKDLSPLLLGVKMVRIAVWDRVNDGIARTVQEALTQPTELSAIALRKLIHERASS
jgi:hypothetical protein